HRGSGRAPGCRCRLQAQLGTCTMAVEGKVNVVPGSVKITMPKDLKDGRKPVPALFVGATNVACHLSEGFNKAAVPNSEFGSLTDGSIDAAINGPAWRAKGEFEIDN